MDPRPLSFFANAAQAVVTPFSGAADASVTGVVTDSRLVGSGNLFIALKGERHDAHDHLGEVAARGALAAVVARDQAHRVPDGLAALIVENPRIAFGQMAAAYRRTFDLPVVCVGGSNGKTTTKELLAAILSRRFRTLKSQGSFNNDVGVPATLFGLESSHQVVVQEVGTNHPGELGPLVTMCDPRIGVTTSIGREHLEFFVDLAGVAAEEGALAERLPSAAAGGVLVLNGECAFRSHLASRTSARVVHAGIGPGNEWSATIRAMEWGRTVFTVQAPDSAWNGDYFITLPGRHSVSNALLGLATAYELGVLPGDGRDGLAAFQPATQRLRLREAGGVRVLDDTYNANADSMMAALQTLKDLPCTGRRVAVLGDMAELGPETAPAHDEVGRAAARLGIDAVFAVGTQSETTARAAGDGCGVAFSNIETAAPAILHFVLPGDVVVFKGSRSARMERLMEALVRQLELRTPDPLSKAA
jgi:UDP-N-acetylmuramoyl-tripeptide--D-alanyl-D-alanine ligase